MTEAQAQEIPFTALRKLIETVADEAQRKALRKALFAGMVEAAKFDCRDRQQFENWVKHQMAETSCLRQENDHLRERLLALIRELDMRKQAGLPFGLAARLRGGVQC